MTTTQLKQSGGSHVTGATCSVTSASPTVTDTANGFVSSDIGRAITTASTAGRKVLSITNPGTMVMDGNATATTGPQVVTMAPVLTNVSKKSGAYANITDKNTAFLGQLPSGFAILAQHALNVWNISGGTGAAATRAQKLLASVGLFVQET